MWAKLSRGNTLLSERISPFIHPFPFIEGCSEVDRIEGRIEIQPSIFALIIAGMMARKDRLVRGMSYFARNSADVKYL
jgi:hypothetical protein